MPRVAFLACRPGLMKTIRFMSSSDGFSRPVIRVCLSKGQPGESEETPSVPRGVGSGFIISTDGFILSNHHVVEGADEVFVSMTDGREFKAKIVGSDQRTDVALLKIEAKNLPVLPLGDPSKLKVGAWLWPLGLPSGLRIPSQQELLVPKGATPGITYLSFKPTLL